MKKSYIAVALAVAILGGSTLTSCIGSFQLTNKLLTWNRSVGNKFVNELVFVAFWILPVYEISALADVLVINSIEFWSGSNPLAHGTKKIQGEDGQIYLVKADPKGYTITNPDGSKTRLDFNAETNEWSTNINGEDVVFLAWVDDTHIRVPGPDGQMHTYTADQQGLYAYQALAAASNMAAK
ncbi:MAG: DUF3332 domain-containing protein [Muribaculaceae bacterium]